MSAVDFITELFCKVDDELGSWRRENHPQETIHVSEIVTLALVYSLKGCGQRKFYRWLTANHRDMFPNLLERTLLFRIFNVHRVEANECLAAPSLIGVIDSNGIELLHPRRERRSGSQIGKKGLSNRRWIVGGKLCFVFDHLGQIDNWDCDTANVYDGSAFQYLIV